MRGAHKRNEDRTEPKHVLGGNQSRASHATSDEHVDPALEHRKRSHAAELIRLREETAQSGPKCQAAIATAIFPLTGGEDAAATPTPTS